MAITLEHAGPTAHAPLHISEAEALGHLLDGIVGDHMDANRRFALRARRIVEAMDVARRHPSIYTVLEGPKAIEIAERAVLFDLSVRLQLTEQSVRGLARTAEDAHLWLPELWRRAEEGYASLTLVESALIGAYRLLPRGDASESDQDAARAAIRELDDAASEWALTCTPASFRSRVTRLAERLDARRADIRHAIALRERRVVVESVRDGMAWVSALLPAHEAFAIKRRLTSTAKHLAKDTTEHRSRDQLRADLFSAWMRGAGTPWAVKTRVYVTIPVQVLAGDPIAPKEVSSVVGHGPIDPLTAKQLFLEATAFRRVLTDPVRGVIVDLERTVYRPTQAQREWLVLQHGTCARDGCTRLALDCDIDHDRPWARGGPTDLSNERPLCPADHRLRHTSRVRFDTRPNGSVRVTTPTGYASTQPPPF